MFGSLILHKNQFRFSGCLINCPMNMEGSNICLGV